MPRLAVAEDAQAQAVAVESKAPAAPSAAYSTRGGATLGDGMAMRVQFGGNTMQNVNTGHMNIEAGMLFALSKSFDIGFNLRMPLFNFGVSPGLAIRLGLVDDTKFMLSLVANVQVPMIFAPGTWVGLSVEPGLMMSYFFDSRVELFGGLLFNYSPLFVNPWVPGSGHAGFSGTFRLGLAYNLLNSNWGFFANGDIGVGYEPVRRYINVGDRASGLAFNAGLTVGSQYKF